jgi:glycerol-1-phosphate dehydrogenase [NAD(P)+]
MNLTSDIVKSAGIHTYMGGHAIDAFTDYVVRNKYQRLVIVADDNTYNVIGNRVERALQKNSINPHTLVLHGNGDPINAGARSVLDVLIALEAGTEVVVAVGSGTITDIVRFVSHRTRLPFISIPTAASVDAYSSITTSIMVEEVKRSLQAKQPKAIFVSIDTLRKAPQTMTAAGFGDMLAKYTAIADWKLAHLLVGEPYDDSIVQSIKTALQQCIDNVKGIGTHSKQDIQLLMEGLFVSGICMAAAKNSRPAAGSEHSLAHFWEMTHPENGKPVALHGARTGVATGVISGIYEQLRSLSYQEVERWVQAAALPQISEETAGIQNVFGESGPQINDSRFSFLGMSQTDFQQLKKNILINWDEIVAIASEVPSRERIVSLLHQAKGASDPLEIGIAEEQVSQALRWSSYLRDRFTVLELNQILKLID